MKRIAMLAAALTASVAMADKQIVATFQLANVDKVAQSAAKVLEMSGIGGIGPMLVAQLPQSDITNFCGTSRMVFVAEGENANPFALGRGFAPGQPALPENVLARFELTTAAAPFLERLVAAAQKDGNISAADAKKFNELIKGLQGARIDVSMNDAGIEIYAVARGSEGSKLLEFCGGTLDASPLAFAEGAPAAALAGSCKYGMDAAEAINKLLAIFARNGAPAIDFLKASTKNGASRIDFDPKAFVAHMTSDKTGEAMAKLDISKLKKEIEDFKAGLGEAKPGEKSRAALYIAGDTSKESAQDAFARILPEASGVKCTSAGVVKAYAVAKSLFAAFAGNPAMDANGIFAKLVPALPPVENSGIGVMMWKEGCEAKFRARISTAEIRGIGSSIAVSLASKAAAGGAIQNAAIIEDDDDDEDDEDDDD